MTPRPRWHAFLEGFCAAFDFFGWLFDEPLSKKYGRMPPLPPLPPMPPRKTVEEAFAEDAAKLAGDWQRVGDDLRAAFEKTRKEIEARHKR